MYVLLGLFLQNNFTSPSPPPTSQRSYLIQIFSDLIYSKLLQKIDVVLRSCINTSEGAATYGMGVGMSVEMF